MHIAQEIIKNIGTRTPDDVITLDYEGRFLRRKRLMTDSGEAFLVELTRNNIIVSNRRVCLRGWAHHCYPAKTSNLCCKVTQQPFAAYRLAYRKQAYPLSDRTGLSFDSKGPCA